MSKEAEKYIDKYTTKDQNDWLVQKKIIVAKFMQSYADEQLEKDLKKHCTEFFYWWYNQGGTNTEQGFDEWYKLKQLEK